MITMIGGVITVVALIVTRMPQGFAGAPQIPADLALPAGTTAEAVTFGKGWIAVVTADNRLLMFDHKGVMIQDIPLPRPD